MRNGELLRHLIHGAQGNGTLAILPAWPGKGLVMLLLQNENCSGDLISDTVALDSLETVLKGYPWFPYFYDEEGVLENLMLKLDEHLQQLQEYQKLMMVDTSKSEPSDQLLGNYLDLWTQRCRKVEEELICHVGSIEESPLLTTPEKFAFVWQKKDSTLVDNGGSIHGDSD